MGWEVGDSVGAAGRADLPGIIEQDRTYWLCDYGWLCPVSGAAVPAGAILRLIPIMSGRPVARKLTRAGATLPDPANTDTRMRAFAAGLGRSAATLLTTSDGSSVSNWLLTDARHDSPNAALALAHAVGAHIDLVDGPPDLFDTAVVGALRADRKAPPMHSTVKGSDAAETARRVETALRHQTGGVSWVAATMRKPNRRERRRTDRWYSHRLSSSAPVHHYRDPNAVTVTITAGGDCAGGVRDVLAQVAAALPGFDLATKVRVVHPTLAPAALALVAGLLTALFLTAGEPGPAVLMAAVGTGLAAGSWFGLLGGGTGLLRSARRTVFPAPRYRATRPAKPVKGRPPGDDHPGAPDRPGDYPLHRSVFLVGPGILAGLVAPHSGAEAEQVVTRQRPVPPELLDPDVGPWVGRPDGATPTVRAAATAGTDVERVDAGPGPVERVRLSAVDFWLGVMAFGRPGSGKSALLAALYGWHCLERVHPSGRPGFPGRNDGLIAFENKGSGAAAYLAYARAAGDQPLLVQAGDPATFGIDVFHIPTPTGRPLPIAERARMVVNMLVYAFADGEIQGRAYETLSATILAAITVTDQIAADAGLPAGHSPVFYAHVLCGGRGDPAGVALAAAITTAAARAEKAGRSTAGAGDLVEADTRLAFLYAGKVTEARRRDATESARRRLGELLAAEAWWTPNRPKVTWEQVISGHHSVIVNTGSTGATTLDPRVTGYLSAILMFALRDTVARICSGWRDQGRSTTIFADELKLLSADSPEVIAWLHDQGRDYGIRPLFATQRDDQLPPALLSSVLDFGTVLWFAQNNPDTAARAARDLAAGTGEGTWTADEIINLPDHHCVVRASVRGRRQPAVPVHLTWFGNRTEKYPQLQGYPTPGSSAGPLAVDAPAGAGGSR